MIEQFAIKNYRSIIDLVTPMGSLNVITGVNGSGKSNLYRALRLLSETAKGSVVNSLALEGGLKSTFWAGPEKITKGMLSGEIPVQGTSRKSPVRLKLGFRDENFGYAISLGLPKPENGNSTYGLDENDRRPSAFKLDPEIKRECIWAGSSYRPNNLLVDRKGGSVRIRINRKWETILTNLDNYESLFDRISYNDGAPEIFHIRELIRGWRFYDHFRTDHEAPARTPQLGTLTTVLSNDGRDLAAALQTIREIGNREMLDQSIQNAFPGSQLDIETEEGGNFLIALHQNGLLRPLSGRELSDGTLRYLLWVAALLTPRPPSMMVLNEPETSLHPDLIPALAKLIIYASEQTQVWVVSHSAKLVAALKQFGDANSIELEKELGRTAIKNQDEMAFFSWKWPD